MAEEDGRDQPPTPKRLSEARKKGNVAKSQELSMALSLLFSFICLKMFATNILMKCSLFMEKTLTSMSVSSVNSPGISKLFLDFWLTFFVILLPIFVILSFLNLLVMYLQVGSLYVPIHLKFESLNPVNGFKKFLSPQSFVELCKSVLKMIVVGYIGYGFFRSNLPDILSFKFSSPQIFIYMIGDLVYKLVMKIIPVYLVLSVADYAYMRYTYYKGLKMSRHEIKEEAKQAENPTIKGNIRKRRMEMFRKLSLKQVPGASVVVTNPTHIAVALRYDDTMEVPMVIAKGVDLFAQKIKEIAKKHKIPLVEDKPLARALNEIEINNPIPSELYMAVAKIIVHISSLGRSKVK